MSEAVELPEPTSPGSEEGLRGQAPGQALIPRGPLASVVGGAYDGASKFDAEVFGWAPPLRSADGDMLADKPLADARARDSDRNDAFVNNGTKIHKDTIVGAFYRLNAKPAAAALGLDDTWATEFQEEVETKFPLWGESANFWADAKRTKTFTDMIRLAVGLDVVGGEILASVEWIRDRDPRRVLHTAINFVDADRLSNPNGVSNTKTLRNGVEMDDFGAPIAYHVRNGHPGDWWNGYSDWDWTRVPATKPWGRIQMIHLLEETRPEQTRGISQMVTALSEMKMTKGFRRITLQNAVVNATYAASIESELPSEVVFAQLGAQDGVGKAITEYAKGYLGAITAYAKSGRGLTLDGFKIPHLFPGTKLQLRPAGTPGGIGTDFEDSLLRYLSAALDISVEELTHNFTNTNYSSIKAAIAMTRRTMASKKKRTADRLATMIYWLWLEEMLNNDLIESMPKNAPDFYEGMNQEAYCQCEWIGAAVGQIDELKETQAAALRINSAISTYEIECARQGLDWREVFRQKAREKKLLTELDLWDDLQAASGQQNQNMLNSTTGDTRNARDSSGGSQGANND